MGGFYELIYMEHRLDYLARGAQHKAFELILRSSWLHVYCIVGSIIGKGKVIKRDDIYDAMLYIHEQGKITIAKLAEVLSCSQRTIHRNIGEELKREKELLNRQHEKI